MSQSERKNMKYSHEVAGLKADIDLIETDLSGKLYPLNPKDFFWEGQKMGQKHYLRKEVVNMLLKAKSFLPKGYTFFIYETFRSHEKQQAMFQSMLLKMQEKCPNLSLKELREKTNVYVADPDGIGSGHQTGAAIDLTICDLNKNCLDMGAKYLEADDEKTAMASKKIPLMAIKNRYLFKRVMEEAGFLNYPPEWWHFSYGEHEWAVLSGKHKTIYRAIKNPVVVLNKERQRG